MLSSRAAVSYRRLDDAGSSSTRARPSLSSERRKCASCSEACRTSCVSAEDTASCRICTISRASASSLRYSRAEPAAATATSGSTISRQNER